MNELIVSQIADFLSQHALPGLRALAYANLAGELCITLMFIIAWKISWKKRDAVWKWDLDEYATPFQIGYSALILSVFLTCIALLVVVPKLILVLSVPEIAGLKLLLGK